MNRAEFTDFLQSTLGNASRVMRGWRDRLRLHGLAPYARVLGAGDKVITELKNLCVWNKTNGGMGTFYRSKHELVFVFKNGTAPYQHFGLGDTDAIAPTFGTMPGSTPCGAARRENWRCIRP